MWCHKWCLFVFRDYLEDADDASFSVSTIERSVKSFSEGAHLRRYSCPPSTEQAPQPQVTNWCTLVDSISSPQWLQRIAFLMIFIVMPCILHIFPFAIQCDTEFSDNHMLRIEILITPATQVSFRSHIFFIALIVACWPQTIKKPFKNIRSNAKKFSKLYWLSGEICV